MIARLYSLNKQFINLNGKLLALPKLTKAFIMNALGYGWDRNRAIDTLGTQNNALMGGYLLAASNTVIAITGILTTDTIAPLTSGGNVGTVMVNGTISFSTGLKYGAFEVYRGTTRIGRYCLTERQGLQIINQVTGGLPNGLLGGTTTTVWQRSNAFYCDTNYTGYSISSTGWVTSAGAVLTVGTIITSDPLNPTKCMAWVGVVQQDLQYVGKARNSVSVVPYVFYCNGDRRWAAYTQSSGTIVNTYSIRCVATCTSTTNTTIFGGFSGNKTRNDANVLQATSSSVQYITEGLALIIELLPQDFGQPFDATVDISGLAVTLTVIMPKTGITYTVSGNRSQLLMNSTAHYIATHGVNTDTISRYYGVIGYVKVVTNGVVNIEATPDQHSTSFICLKQKLFKTITGITTSIYSSVDLIHMIYNKTGFELWINGSAYQIYPLASDGTRLKTPAGYSLAETVTAGNMPSVADSRMSTFKYSLANSYALRQSVPEAFDADAQATPKLLTYPELSALSNNDKVFITESNGKITNIKAT